MKIQRRAEGACASASASSRLKRAVIAAFVALVVFALAIPAGSAWASTSAGAAHVNYAGGTTDGGDIAISKTAADATKADTFDITLSVEGSEARDNVAVLFVLDKSTSQDVRTAAAEMLNTLKAKTNTNIIYDVVIFSGTATSTGWQDIADDQAFADTQKNFANAETTSGTNMDAGLQLASQELKNAPAGYETYLVTISDGITYVWSEDGEVKTVPVTEFGSKGVLGPQIQSGTSTWDSMYSPGTSFEEVYGSFYNFLQVIPEKMKATRTAGCVATYGGPYDLEDGVIKTYNEDYGNTGEDWKKLKKAVAKRYACGPEFASYVSATGYEALAEAVDHSFAFAMPEQTESGSDKISNWDAYPWGKELMQYCQSLSDNKDWAVEYSNNDAEKIFGGISDEILYAVNSGIVTDTMGSAVDFVASDTLEVTVADKATGESKSIALNKQAAEGSYVSDDGFYAAQIATDESGNEVLTWEINTPVVQGTQVSLQYTVKLPAENKATTAGTYEELTNESAVFAYESKAGDSASLEFAKPRVSYTVEEQVTPVVPPATEDDPSGDNNNQTTNNESNSSATVSVTTASGTADDTSSSSPKTGDAFGLAPLVALLVVAGASGAGIFAWRKLR